MDGQKCNKPHTLDTYATSQEAHESRLAEAFAVDSQPARAAVESSLVGVRLIAGAVGLDR